MMVRKINFINNNKDVFHIFIYAFAGSIYESEKVRGISHLLEHMLLKHTKAYTEKELLQQITSLGGSYNAVTDRDVTFYYIMTHMDNFRKSVDILHSAITEPVFTKYELDMERKVVLEEINRRVDSDGDLLNLSYLSVLHENNVYAQPIEGYRKTLNSITVKDLYDYHRDRYQKYMVFINCDKRKQKEVENYVYSKFGRNQEVFITDPPSIFSNLALTSRIFVVYRSYSQYSTHLIFPSLPRALIKDNIVLNFVKYCLVSAGLYSILTYQLRSKRGLIYSVSSLNETYRYTGIMRIVIATSDKDTDRIVSIVLDILLKLQKHGMSDKLIKFFKKGFLNEQKFALTNEEFMTSFHGGSLFYDCDISNAEYIETVKNINNDDVRDIAKRVFDVNKIGVLSYGNYKSETAMERLIADLLSSYSALQ